MVFTSNITIQTVKLPLTIFAVVNKSLRCNKKQKTARYGIISYICISYPEIYYTTLC